MIVRGSGVSAAEPGSVTYHPRTPDETGSVVLGRAPASTWPRVSAVTTFGFRPTRAEPRESLPNPLGVLEHS